MLLFTWREEWYSGATHTPEHAQAHTSRPHGHSSAKFQQAFAFKEKEKNLRAFEIVTICQTQQKSVSIFKDQKEKNPPNSEFHN